MTPVVRILSERVNHLVSSGIYIYMNIFIIYTPVYKYVNTGLLSFA